MNIQIWMIDCQNDFIKGDGALPVPGACEILDNLGKLRKAATDCNIKVVYTMDEHLSDDEEISDQPDFKTTFPPHCILGTYGSDLVNSVKSKAKVKIIGFGDSLIYELDNETVNIFDDDIAFTKNVFSIFDGNKNAETYVKLIRPDIIFVCGVAGDVCVKAVVEGFLDMNALLKDLKDTPMRICVVQDAIASLNDETTKQLYRKLDSDETGIIVDTDFVWEFLKIVEGLGDTL
jgi:nicotinamidase/pyrazinamidase